VARHLLSLKAMAARPSYGFHLIPAGTVLLLASLAVAGEEQNTPMRLDRIHRLQLDLGRRTRAQCIAGADEVSAELHLQGPGALGLLARGRRVRIGPYEMRLRRSHYSKAQVVGVIDAGKGTVRCRIQRTRRRLHLLVGMSNLYARMSALKRAVRLPAAASDQAPSVKEQMERVDRLFHDGKLDAAEQELESLRRHTVLDDYATLRRADLHLLRGRVPTAFEHYYNMASRRGRAGVGLLAEVRAAQLAYLVNGTDPHDELIEAVVATKGDLGRIERGQAALLLLDAGHAERALSLLVDDVAQFWKPLSQRLVLTVIRRAMWRNDAFSVARYALLAKHVIADHPQRASILNDVAQAYLDLGLPDEAPTLLQEVIRQDGVPAATKERAVFELLRAYVDADDHFRARQVADYHLTTFPRSYRRAAVVRARIRLRVLEGDMLGAREDLKLLATNERAAAEKLLTETTQQYESSWSLLHDLRQRQLRLARGIAREVKQ